MVRVEVPPVVVREVSISQMWRGGLEAGRGRFLRDRTSGVRVAVKRQVWRSEDGGRAERQVSTSGSMLPGPEARRRSASSRMTMRVRLRPAMVSLPEVVM